MTAHVALLAWLAAVQAGPSVPAVTPAPTSSATTTSPATAMPPTNAAVTPSASTSVAVPAPVVTTASLTTNRAATAPELLPPGRYAFTLRIAVTAPVPVLGQMITWTRAESLVDVVRDARGLLATQTACGLRTDGGGTFVTTAPPAFVRSLGTRSYRIDVDDNGAMRADLGMEHSGYDPSRTPGGGLPRNSKDRAVIDEDHDGKPGVTMDLNVPGLPQFHIAVATRGHTVLEGRVTTSGRVEGGPHVLLAEQLVLDGLPFSPPKNDSPPDPARSAFVFQRLADGATCKDVQRMQ